MSSTRRDSRAFTITVSVLVAVGGLLMLAILALSGAPAIMFLATGMAAVPVVPLVLCYLWLDRYEPEPKKLLAYGLLWGAFVATIAAILIGGLGGLVVPFTEEQSLAIVAPVTEEASKGLFLLLLLWWRRAELDGVLDGIVYAGMVGIGFAFTENILYLAAAYNGSDGVGPGGVVGITTTFVLRCLLSPFAHPLFTTFIGIGVGLAVTSRKSWVRILAPLGGYVCAVGAHGLWNGSTIYGAEGFFGVYLVLMVPAFVGLVLLGVWARRSEARMLTVALADAAQRGLMPATDIGWVVDLRARRTARQYAKQYAGPDAAKAMSDYQQAAIELGFLHHRLLRGTAPADYQVRGQEYLARINAVRPRIAFPGQVVPTR
jgi:RsiW-degrading membrane proteinase PrsW (M82 family)